MFARIDFKLEAKENLRGNWSYIAGITVIIMVLSVIANMLLGWLPIIGNLLLLFVSAPFQLSSILIAIKLYKNKEIPINDIFSGFKFTMKAVGLTLWMDLWIFLWSLLLIIPGLVKSYSYSMAFICLLNNPELTIREALRESMRITNGFKGNLFMLDLSWLGWELVCVMTCFIGFIFFAPYQTQTSYIAFRYMKAHYDGYVDTDDYANTTDENTTSEDASTQQEEKSITQRNPQENSDEISSLKDEDAQL